MDAEEKAEIARAATAAQLNRLSSRRRRIHDDGPRCKRAMSRRRGAKGSFKAKIVQTRLSLPLPTPLFRFLVAQRPLR